MVVSLGSGLAVALLPAGRLVVPRAGFVFVWLVSYSSSVGVGRRGAYGHGFEPLGFRTLALCRSSERSAGLCLHDPVPDLRGYDLVAPVTSVWLEDNGQLVVRPGPLRG